MQFIFFCLVSVIQFMIDLRAYQFLLMICVRQIVKSSKLLLKCKTKTSVLRNTRPTTFKVSNLDCYVF